MQLRALASGKSTLHVEGGWTVGLRRFVYSDGDTDAEVRDVDSRELTEPDSSAVKIKNSPRGSKEQKKLIIRVFDEETLRTIFADINREIELIRAKGKRNTTRDTKSPSMPPPP